MPSAKIILIMLTFTCLTACTTGRFEYTTPEGEVKVGCEVEYTWQPSVDKYAVEHILSYCAKKAVEKGNAVNDLRLLELDLSIPAAPSGQSWSHQLAKKQHQASLLTDKEYGYIIAYIDLGHEKTAESDNP
jgi:hypothetical protein